MSDKLKYDQFYEAAMQADFPDKMVLGLKRKRMDNGTFSREAVDSIVDSMEAFLLARLRGRWDGTGRPPRRMRVRIEVDWEPYGDLRNSDDPWYFLEDYGTSLPDGDLRIDATRRSRNGKQ